MALSFRSRRSPSTSSSQRPCSPPPAPALRSFHSAPPTLPYAHDSDGALAASKSHRARPGSFQTTCTARVNASSAVPRVMAQHVLRATPLRHSPGPLPTSCLSLQPARESQLLLEAPPTSNSQPPRYVGGDWSPPSRKPQWSNTRLDARHYRTRTNTPFSALPSRSFQ